MRVDHAVVKGFDIIWDLIQLIFSVLLEYGAEKEECEEGTTTSACTTVGGAMPYAKCVFPFRFEGKTYCGCNADNVEGNGIWCSTRTDEMDRHTNGFWGICSDDCPIG